MRRLAALLVVAALVGCGGSSGDNGSAAGATLWVTRDEGREVLLVAQVPAGLTALQALDRETDLETRYGGRYVQAINGVAGSIGAQRDWFYFVNGYELDRGAAEYRLREGDVEWWDYRSWAERDRQPFAVGAFPEPFLHGFDGKRRPAVVRYRSAQLAPVARELARLVQARSVEPTSRAAPAHANVLFVDDRPGAHFYASPRQQVQRPGDPVHVVVGGEATARRLARDPALFRFRYEARP